MADRSAVLVKVSTKPQSLSPTAYQNRYIPRDFMKHIEIFKVPLLMVAVAILSTIYQESLFPSFKIYMIVSYSLVGASILISGWLIRSNNLGNYKKSATVGISMLIFYHLIFKAIYVASVIYLENRELGLSLIKWKAVYPLLALLIFFVLASPVVISLSSLGTYVASKRYPYNHKINRTE